MKIVKLTEADALLLLGVRPRPLYQLVEMGRKAIGQAGCGGIGAVRNDLYDHYFFLIGDGLVEHMPGRTPHFRLTKHGLWMRGRLLELGVGNMAPETEDAFVEDIEDAEDEDGGAEG